MNIPGGDTVDLRRQRISGGQQRSDMSAQTCNSFVQQRDLLASPRVVPPISSIYECCISK